MFEPPSASNSQEANASQKHSELCSDDCKVFPKEEALLYLRKALDLHVVSADQVKLFLLSYNDIDE